MKLFIASMTTAVLTAISISAAVSVHPGVDADVASIDVAILSLRKEPNPLHDDWEWLAPNRKLYA